MLKILYQDDHYAAIEKPPGVFVHRFANAPYEDSCMRMLRDQLNVWVYPIHRLDRAASGVLLFSLSAKAADRMCKQMEERRIRKTYHAIVRGWTPEKGKLTRLLPDRERNLLQEALTFYRCSERWEVDRAISKWPSSRYSLVEIHPETGRRHQIRRHFAHVAHPIVGDTTYGDRKHNRAWKEHGLLLHASAIEFEHPYSFQRMQIESPPARLERFARGFDSSLHTVYTGIDHVDS